MLILDAYALRGYVWKVKPYANVRV